MSSVFENNLKINKVNIRGYWSWDVHNDTCPVCRYNLIESCDNITHAVIGECGHAFHFECIKTWLKTNHNCPLCNQKWIFKKNPCNFDDYDSTQFTDHQNNIINQISSFIPIIQNMTTFENNEQNTITENLDDSTDEDMPNLIDDDNIPEIN